ncbi:MAG: hypothetical protein Q4A63_03110 [Butyricicoccus pullicaecorum]|nr:hypothetical protein [Butyricicoccus pullicaecorum]MDO4668787.1 hypothetical protein [Butyricicoccus pullicaecorum]
MERLGFYEAKYTALESFYGWVDQSSSYEVAAEQCIYYDTSLRKKIPFYNFILHIEIANRFVRSGRSIPPQFAKRVQHTLETNDISEFQEYCLPHEFERLHKEVSEAKMGVMQAAISSSAK